MEDVIIGVFSGDKMGFGRALAMRNTWMQRFPHNHIYACSWNNITGVVGLGISNEGANGSPSQYNFKSDYHEMQAPQFVQMYGLKEMYKKHPTAKWFYMVGDDGYMDTDKFMAFMNKYDKKHDTMTEAIHLGGLLALERMPDFINKNEAHYPKYVASKLAKRNVFQWFYGSDPFILSNKACKMFAEGVDKYMTENDIHKHTYERDQAKVPGGMGYWPDKLTGMLLSLLGGDEMLFDNALAKEGLASARELKRMRPQDHQGSHHSDFFSYHYVDPGQMLLVDLRATHEKLDRFTNAMSSSEDGVAKAALPELLAWMRNFIDEHFNALRRDQQAIKYVAERYSRTSWPCDGGSFLQFNWSPHYNGITPLLQESEHWTEGGGNSPKDKTPYVFTTKGHTPIGGW